MFYTVFNKTKQYNSWAIAVLSGILLTVTACTKGSIVGSDILPSDDLIQVTSDTTFTMTAQTINNSAPLVFNNSLLINDTTTLIRNYLLGSYDDPVFGRTSATIYAQFRPDNKPNDIPTSRNLPVDSIVLVIPYTYNADQYGDTLSPQKVKVFRITEDLGLNTMYSANKDFATESTPLGQATFTPKNTKTRKYTHKYVKTVVTSVNPIQKDSLVWYWTDLAYPTKELHIKLDNALFTEFLAHNSEFLTNNTFATYFKGLKICPDTTFNSAMLRFNLLSINAGLFVYQHDTSTTPNVVNNLATNPNRYRDTVIYKKRLIYHEDARPRTIRFNHNRAGTPVQAAIARTTADRTSDVYLQGLGGPLARLNFTNIKNLGKVIINKAELFIVTPDEVDKKYKQPSALFAYRRNTYGSFVEIRDLYQTLVNSSSAYPYYGRRNLERINGQSCAVYNMNIGDHIQDIVNGTYPPYLYLSVLEKRERPERLVIKQSLTNRHGFFLRIHYTKI